MDSKEITTILSKWGEIPQKISMKRDVYKIKTDKGKRCFKKFNSNIDRLLFMVDAMNYVEQNGFNLLPRCIPSLDGKFVVEENGIYYLVQEWLDGKEPDYRNDDEIALAAESIAMFHKASKGFTPNAGYKAKNKLGKWPRKLEKKAADLEFYLNLAKDASKPTEFEQELMKYGGWLVNHARESIKKLHTSKYGELVAEASNEYTLVHGDTATRNCLVHKGKVYLIDFDSLAIDITVADLWRLLRRTMRREQWEIKLVDKVLTSYNKQKPLETEELEVLGAFLQFPEKPWRTAKEYYERRNSDDWNESKVTKKMINFLKQHKEIDKFYAQFEKKYNLWRGNA